MAFISVMVVQDRTPMKTNKKLNSFDKQTHFVTRCVVFCGEAKRWMYRAPPIFTPSTKITGRWFQIVFMFTLFGEDSNFDQ